MSKNLPDRYGIEMGAFDGKTEKAIFRKDLVQGGNRAYMVRGLLKSGAELRSPEHLHRHIYLDGAARGPYYDMARQIYSLDHHEECIRQITESTCVQGTNLARTRIIDALGHTIVGNDPDGDTVFGTWSLLNADYLAQDDRIFRRMQPLMLLEGNIDAYGFGYEELTGLPADTIAETRELINWIIDDERTLKARGRWNTLDFVDYTEGALRKLDRYALYRYNLDRPTPMQVHDKMPLKNGQALHYIQAPESGIYEVEYTVVHHEKDRNAACIIFHDGKSKWTLKLTGFLNQHKLGSVADALNKKEQEQKIALGITDEAMLKALWGGGETIMGSPRYPNGSGPLLTRTQIVDTVAESLNAQQLA